MRCDDVFEILTAGPFPSGVPTDKSVEQHLRFCHECRRLAMALQPIAETAESAGLPVYKGDHGATAETASSLEQRIRELVMQDAPQRDVQTTPPRHPASRSRGRRIFASLCAAACLLGAAAAWGGPLLSSSFGARPTTTEAHAALQPVSAALGGACSVDLTAQLTSENAPEPASAGKEACCIECHGGSRRPQSSRSDMIGLLVVSCQKCHQAKSDLVRL